MRTANLNLCTNASGTGVAVRKGCENGNNAGVREAATVGGGCAHSGSRSGHSRKQPHNVHKMMAALAERGRKWSIGVGVMQQ